jgi:hypothetical protein
MTTRTIGTSETHLAAPRLRAADWLCLAAAPTFALMAFATLTAGGAPSDIFCAAAQQASPLHGMALMYLLMSAFHLPPWLKLIRRRAS